ncbi:DUF3500 domain-containing protein [Streptomyces sp. Qhu-G9]|uniref:DUF3500 domain-containing protein n=1 Tax=Streptomyces sp. Qhu-G9 TaxID=3452799 RepID=UPI0022AC558B|nr:DUF3500 domain-containing protein [Streptomyces aurantiacus]WAU82544.1 DUF3500 domain-containing protein [Streptomyces aurantiacus]
MTNDGRNARTPTASAPGREGAAAAMATAAATWLGTLSREQLRFALFDSPLDPEAEAERLRWFYTPTNHGGLAIREQSAYQQSLAMQLVATGLSEAGYATVATVMGLENILDQVEGWRVDWGRERGRDPGLYWLRVFGRPGDPVWAWRFGGHHISLNNLIVANRLISTTPCFIGADPAKTALLGGTLSPLGGAEDQARLLARTLNSRQFRQALLHPSAVSDIVSGNRPRVRADDTMMHMQDLWRDRFADPALARLVDDIDRRAEEGSGYTEDDHARLAITVPPQGVSARDLDEGQRDGLRQLLAMYTGRTPEALAGAYDARFAADGVLDEVHFSWAGSLTAGEPHYYRVQGPSVLIEYDNTQRHANHAHSVWRDLTSDFGLDVLAEHRAATAH